MGSVRELPNPHPSCTISLVPGGCISDLGIRPAAAAGTPIAAAVEEAIARADALVREGSMGESLRCRESMADAARAPRARPAPTCGGESAGV